jgi:RNA polymerase sigma factor (sigma-70 family)
VNEADTAEVPVARAGSADHLSALYHDDYHRFLRVAEAITRDPEGARDAVQDGFANALRDLDRYAGRGSFEGWVWRCVVNAARMARRKSRFRPVPPFGDAAAPLEPSGSLLEQIAALPERQRLVLFLRYFADLSYDGIAEAVDVSPGTVAATLNAAHRALRRQLEEGDDD